MGLINLLIIYLAIGVPFGIYYIVLRPGDDPIAGFWSIILNTILWPLAGPLLVYTSYAAWPGKPSDELALMCEMEKIASRDKASSVFEFREVLSRYVGLCTALEAPIGTKAIESLADIGCISNIETAKACSRRRNHEILYAQQLAASDDYIRLVTAAMMNTPLMISCAIHLSSSLNDHQTAELLNSLLLNAGDRTSSKTAHSDRLPFAA